MNSMLLFLFVNSNSNNVCVSIHAFIYQAMNRNTDSGTYVIKD